jgi:hypothetical protein
MGSTTFSYTGTLITIEDVFTTTVTLNSAGSLELQTFGFGGGTNGAGTPISAGGIDPLVALFVGTGPTAVFVDGTSDVLSNYPSFAGCPPAGLQTIGSFDNQCGDITMLFTGLAAGTYTVLLSDGSYIPSAFFEPPGGTLGDGFNDLTSGFQTCVDTQDCKTDTGDWALDVTTSDTSGVPEPSSAGLAALGMALIVSLTAVRHKRRNRI